MKNIDKYRDEINRWLETEKPLCNLRYALEKAKCPDMLCQECREDTFKWLCKEYEPPLLKNGDGLKPGDWLEIEDDNDGRWYKGRFIGYLDGRFYVKHEGDQHLFGVSSSVHARLLEDGE